MNPLDEHPKIRKAAYYVQWVVNLLLGATAVVLTALEQSPLWYVIATGVFNFIWSYVGLTAGRNTQTGPDA